VKGRLAYFYFQFCLTVTGVLASVGWREVWRPSPQGGSGSLQWSEIGMEDPQEDPLAVHCFCVYSGSVLLGDLLGISRSRERDLLSALSIYPRFFGFYKYTYPRCIYCVSSHFLSLFYSAIIWCMFVALVLATPVLWCWSWEKEGRAVEVVPGF